MCVRYIVAHSRNHCCHGNSTVPSLFIVVGLCIAVKTWICSVLPRKCNSVFPLYFRTVKHFVLLLTKISIEYKTLRVYFLALAIRHASHIFSVVCLSLPYFFNIVPQTAWFFFWEGGDTEHKIVWTFILQLLSETFFILRKIQRKISIHLRSYSYKVINILSRY
jgi:hypothetical protein